MIGDRPATADVPDDVGGEDLAHRVEVGRHDGRGHLTGQLSVRMLHG